MPLRFGEKLRTLRLQQDMTQAALARELHLQRAHINNLEVGRRAPSLEVILHIAEFFNVTTDYLLRDAIPVEPTSAHTTNLPGTRAPVAQSFGRKLVYLRELHNITQTDVARRAALTSRGYVSNLETGRKAPSPELVPILADIFGVTTDYLLRDVIRVDIKEDSG